MIDDLIVTVSEFETSRVFYQKALQPLGFKAPPEVCWGTNKARGVGSGAEDMECFVVEGPTVKPAVHLAFRVATRAEVETFYQAAIAAGGRDNGT